MNKNSPKSNLTKLSYLSTMEKQIYDLDHIIFVDCITFLYASTEFKHNFFER